MNCLCIDFGSTFIKYYIYEKNQTIASGKLDFPKACVDDGIRYEVPLTDIDESVFEVFRLAQAYSVGKCFIAVQMHGYVTKNQQGTFSNYISWKDKSGDISNPWVKDIDFEQNGTSLKSNLPAVKLIAGQREPFTFFTLGSYIAFLLTGRNITHKTDACASGFFDGESLSAVAEAMYITLPTVTQAVIPVGRYHGVEIYTPVGDHQLSFLGSGAEKEAYLLNIGTATQISTLSSTYEKGTPFEKRPYFDRNRLLTVSGLTGGEKLIKGYPVEDFCGEVLSAIKKLPARRKMLVGGGGAELVFDALKSFFEPYNIVCTIVEKNISEEGLRKMSNTNCAEIGTMLSEVAFPNFPVILKNANMDFLIIDCEHGAFDYGFLSAIVMNARLTQLPVIVRLPDNNRRDLTRLVDMGVTGFLLPMTNTAEDIKQVVDFVKYVPIGKRGISTNRAHTFYNPPPLDEYMRNANQTVKVYAQIETRAGIEHLKEILSVEGVDGVFVGPNDLSCDLGCIGDHEPVKIAIREIAEKTRDAEKPWGIITTSKDLIDFSLENGAKYISYGSEINMLKDACKNIRRTVYG